jgi:hypothetical protein
MTNLEIQAANAQIKMGRDVSNILDRLKDNHPTNSAFIDWEQRRYEIAKDVLCSLFAAGKTGDVNDAVQVADALIEALKRKD